MNKNIIPYIPIAPRVQAKTEKSKLLCQQLFNLIDNCVQAQLTFNHETRVGHISLCPDQINDLLNELAKNKKLDTSLDVDLLKKSLSDLIYPKFKGEHTVTSLIWNSTEVRVWQFQLNQIVHGANMETSQNEAELALDCSISALRIWRQSLEASPNDRDITYQTNDLIYKLLDIEHKLKNVQNYLEK